LTGTDIFGHTHQYGFELTFIRTNALGLEPVATIYDGQFAITDLTRGTFTSDEAAYSVQPDVVPPQGGFNTWVDGWHMEGIDGQNQIQAAFLNGSYAIDLSLDQSTPAALHGDDGLMPYGPFGQSFYYSETDLHVSGTMVDHGLPVKVTGIAWQDHQWGDFTPGPGGWTWFSIQLANGTQYMLYFLHHADGNIDQKIGTQINPDGSTVNLDANSIGETPLGSWTSPTTGTTYPQDWNVTVPGGEMTVTALEANQELSVPLVASTDYWEGDSSVSGEINGQQVNGESYAEVTPHLTMLTAATSYRHWVFDLATANRISADFDGTDAVGLHIRPKSADASLRHGLLLRRSAASVSESQRRRIRQVVSPRCVHGLVSTPL
jgi:predicted secreted hydrolase